MLQKEEFEKIYKTTYEQVRELSYLDTVSKEDRTAYTDAEILTGRNFPAGSFNKFNTFGSKNKGKKHNTTTQRLHNAWKRYLDSKDEAELNDFFEKMWIRAKRGDFNQAKFLMEKMFGKEPENINLKSEGEISFTIDNTKLIRKKEKE